MPRRLRPNLLRCPRLPHLLPPNVQRAAVAAGRDASRVFPTSKAANAFDAVGPDSEIDKPLTNDTLNSMTIKPKNKLGRPAGPVRERCTVSTVKPGTNRTLRREAEKRGLTFGQLLDALAEPLA